VLTLLLRFRWYLAASFGVGVFSAFNNFTLTLWLASFTTSYVLLGLLGNTKSFEGTVVSPAVGAWSDRVWAGWFGRRRPFILVAGLGSALLLALTPTIGRWPLPAALGWLPAGWLGLVMPVGAVFLFTAAFNAMDDVQKALLVDLTHPEERDRVSALSVVVEMVGQVTILLVGVALWRSSVPDAAFVVTGALMAAGVVVTVLGVREPPPALWRAERAGEGANGGPRLTVGTLLSRYRPAAVFCLAHFAYWSGVNAVMPLVSIYVRDILHGTVAQAQFLPALLLLSTTLCAIPIGKLADRFGKRRVLGAGYLIMLLAALGGMVITTIPQGVVLFLVAGVGSAASVVLAIPLLADLVPRSQIGGAAGILAASGSLAAPLASLAAGGLSDLYGPRAIFAFMAAAVVGALLLLPAVQATGASASGLPEPLEA
jgi:MFS family permease